MTIEDDRFAARAMDVYTSFRTLPRWVQIWVMGVLFPINIAAVLIWFATGHPLAQWTGLAALFVGCVNAYITLTERGVSRLTSVPHLPVWIPAQILAVLWLIGDAPMSLGMTVFALIYAVTIGISNLFDIFDTWRWIRGDRSVAGASGG